MNSKIKSLLTDICRGGCIVRVYDGSVVDHLPIIMTGVMSPLSPDTMFGLNKIILGAVDSNVFIRLIFSESECPNFVVYEQIPGFNQPLRLYLSADCKEANELVIKDIMRHLYNSERWEYRQTNLKSLLYKNCFGSGSKWCLYTYLTDVLIADVKALIINFVLMADKWDVLGFKYIC